MDSESPIQRLMPVTTVAIVVVLFGGLIWAGRLKSFRPEAGDAYPLAAGGEFEVDARLWQDPFPPVAVDHERRRAAKPRGATAPSGAEPDPPAPTASASMGSLSVHIAESLMNGVPVRILGVLVPGTHYAEDRERRRRQRLAVVSALGRLSYAPEHSTKIRYFLWQHGSVTVPYEWFRFEPTDGPPGGRTLVLWLSEAHLSRLDTLGQMLVGLIGERPDANGADPHPAPSPDFQGALVEGRLSLRLIGPWSSTTLIEWLEEIDLARAAIGAGADPPVTRPIELAGAWSALFVDLLSGELGESRSAPLRGRLRRDLTAALANDLRHEWPEARDVPADEVARFLANKSAEYQSWLVDRRIDGIDPVSAARVVRAWRFECQVRSAPRSIHTAASAALFIADVYVKRLPEAPNDAADETALLATLAERITESKPDAPALPSVVAGEVGAAYGFEARSTKELESLWAEYQPTVPRSDETDATPQPAIADGVDVLRHLVIYSASATAAVNDLWDRIAGRTRVAGRSDRQLQMSRAAMRERITCYLDPGRCHDPEHSRQRFVECVVPDERLCAMLVKELERRSIEFDGSNHIALVGEWDTFYGRNFKETFERALQDHVPRQGRRLHEMVHRFSYLRGLDGITPGDKIDRESATADGDRSLAGLQSIDTEQLEEPFGRSQLDAMQRLAVRIRALDARLHRKGERVGVVGVTGSDVYDKQLVLQALRRELPDVIFFTTDLDERLTHPEQYHWSRNLLIASSFGLELDERLQGNIPPFRDSYQTAGYFATLMAVEDRATGVGESDDEPDQELDQAFDEDRYGAGLPTDDEIQGHLTPRLFEIARSGAFDISPEVGGAPIHPERRFDRAHLLKLAAFGVVVLILVWLVCFDVNRGLSRRGQRMVYEACWNPCRRRVIVATVVLFLVLIGCIYASASLPDGEPFALVEGISVWPSELIRLLAICLCAAFICKARACLLQSDHDLTESFRFEPPREKGDLRTGLRRLFRRWRIRAAAAARGPRGVTAPAPRGRLSAEWAAVRDLASRVTAKFGAGDESYVGNTAKSVWRQYQLRDRVEHRCLRVLWSTVLFAGLVLTVLAVFDTPVVPARGVLPDVITRTLSVLSMLIAAILTFWVTDVLLVCQQFIRALAEATTQWSASDAGIRVVESMQLDDEDADDYLDVQVIAERTNAIVPLVMYPLVALTVLLVARAGIFDNWEWLVSILTFFAVLLLYTLKCARGLRVEAERSREAAVDRLGRRYVKMLGLGRADRGRQIKQLIDEIKQIRTGAYHPFNQRPIVQLLVPLGGVAAVVVLELFSLYGI